MAETLAELVKKAKGDRSIREYAKAADVDAGLLSKIINGKNLSPTSKVPSLKVLKKLTSPEADPRGGVTFEKLAKAADSSKQYQSGIKAGLVAAGTLAVGAIAMGGFPVAAGIAASASAVAANMYAENQRGTKSLDESVGDTQRFIAISNGLIMGALGANGFAFRLENENKETNTTTIRIDGKGITDYIFKYVYLTKDQMDIPNYAEAVTKLYIQDLVFKKPSNKRKTTIVMNDADSYKSMLAYRNKISYNGELSIMLIDTDKVRIVKEDYLSHYAGDDQPEEIHLA